MHAQADRHLEHHARPRSDLEPAARESCRMIGTSRSRRAAHRADRMDAKKTGERTGSKPKPPEAGARFPPEGKVFPKPRIVIAVSSS
jgi:hypothetical protein